MKDWTAMAHRLAVNLEERLDVVKRRWNDRFGNPGDLMILPYRGFGTARTVHLQGRVLEDKGILAAADDDTHWDNLLRMYQRFESDERPGVRLRAGFRGAIQEAITDEEGYFKVSLQPTDAPPAEALWHEVTLSLPDEPTETGEPVQATGQVLIPPPACAFGVISDVDDTVIRTGATNFLTMARQTLFGNARTRLPFEGVAAFYRALHRGAGDAPRNPIFYVSSSPWNLYDLLTDFMEVHGIPAGPLFLRDLGLDENKFIKSGHHDHKLAQIERVLHTYPDLPFLLIGDSGQQDPEIYRQVVEDFPGRILAVYIRDVTPEARDEAVRAIARETHAQGVELVLAPDSAAAAAHAARLGFIAADALDEIRAEAQ